MKDTVHKLVVCAIALVALVWTLAGLVTLVYWSGLALWLAAAIAAGTFAWTLRIYLRPTQPVPAKDMSVNRPSV